uniref:Uncharacterized protein n=1 Tax=viral metagenome TaxID=1070528 RepID=A0A6C0BPQ5_9ZZZZ
MGISLNPRVLTTNGSYSKTSRQEKIRLTKTLKDYDLQVIQNNQKIVELSKKINHTCSSYKPFIMQKSCHILYLDIEDIIYDNRKIRMLKRDIYLRYGLDWDEDFN